ncbi:MAG: methylmalonyl-CoA mutase family protein [Hyphomicrobiaceae bacterium]|nr:methylmalonyl-CoA mutase family protein [Hyphomicrobiaceae bacterium]
MTAEPKLPLAASFQTPKHEDWVKLVEDALKGASLDKRLVTRSADGLRIEPLYARRTDAAPVLREGVEQPWAIAARVDHPTPGDAARLALEDLENGVGALSLVFAGSRSARGYGIAPARVAELDAALSGTMLDIVALRLEPAPGGRVNAALMAQLVEARGLAPASCRIAFGLDPIGTLIHLGHVSAPWDAVAQQLAEAVIGLKSTGFPGPFLNVDVRPYHEAGASEGQELAAALATGVTYLRALEAHGLPLAEARRAVDFTIAVDADQLLGLAKLRALRRLWSKVEESCGLAPEPIRIHAETAWRMMTRRDPWVNMLRATMAVFTAGIGGADSVGVLPHTLPLGLPDAFARRIARNTQSILIEESNIWRVADPAAGSGAIEALTDEVARAGWTQFQAIEAEGGLVASLTRGALQARIGAVRASRLHEVATRKSAITGTSEFPLLSEAPVSVLDVPVSAIQDLPALAAGGRDVPFADLLSRVGAGVERTAADSTTVPGGLMAEPLPSIRLAQAYEALRDASDARLAAVGQRPRVFLASLGTIAEHTARSTWIRNTLAAGGIEAEVPEGFASPDATVEAFKASGANVACIASSDAVYADQAEVTARALKAAGARHVMLAGRPGDLEAAFKAAGVDEFIFAGQNMVEVLRSIQDRTP